VKKKETNYILVRKVFTMKLSLVMVTVLGLAFSASLPAAGIELSDIDGRAIWFSHFDIEQFNSSQLRVLADEFGLAEKREKVKQYLGFDPTKTIKGITLYGTSYEPESSAVLLKGSFDTAKLIKLVSKQPEYKVLKYEELEIHTWESFRGIMTSGSFYNGSTLVMARNAEMVVSAIDTLNGKQSSINPAECTTSDSAVFQVFMQDASVIAQSDPKMIFLNNVGKSMFAVGQKDEEFFCELLLQADTTDNGRLLGQMVQGMVAMGKMKAQEKNEPIIATALDKVYVNIEDDMVITTMVIDAEQLSHMIRTFISQKDLLSLVY
jgi:hypothetical protein